MTTVIDRTAFLDMDTILREATTTVDAELRLEDQGWINMSGTGQDIIQPHDRVRNVQTSRLYALKDPMAKQAIRIWTEYTFGKGMEWAAEEEATKAVMEAFWDAKINRPVLSARGQRMSSDKLLIDGEIFFVLFLGPKAVTIRWIDPLEITEIITDPDDKLNVRYYRRQWTDALAQRKDTYYKSVMNMKNEPTRNIAGSWIRAGSEVESAVVLHLALNTITERGNPLLLPALDWLRLHRRFLGSRVAIMLALSKFAWKRKVKGGPAAVEAVRAKVEGADIPAASDNIENEAVDTTPIKQETGAKNAYEDGRMLKLQISAATGIPEQYFGDISTGNLATAKTVELPLLKMFGSYQQVWRDAYKEIDEIVLEHASVPEAKWVVYRDFPPIAPADYLAQADTLTKVTAVFPKYKQLTDVKQVGLQALGINDTKEVLEELEGIEAEKPDPVPPAPPVPGAPVPPPVVPGEEKTESDGNGDVKVKRVLQGFKTVLEEAGKNGKG